MPASRNLLSIRAFQHLIWDWNGTLLDDTWLCIEVMNESLRRRGLPLLTPERYEEVFEFPVINYYHRLGFDFTNETFESAGAEFIATYERRRHEAQLRPEARKVLEGLRAAGLRQSVLSAYRHDTLEELLHFHRVRGFFDHVVGADDIYARGKIGQGRGLIERLALDPARVLLIGDTLHDVEVASAIGCASALIHSGTQSRSRLQSSGAPILSSLADLIPADRSA